GDEDGEGVLPEGRAHGALPGDEIEELTRRVQERFPEIRALRFMLGAVEPVNAPPAAWSPKVSAVPLDDSARSAIDEATSVIHDPTLAAAARRLLTKAWRPSR
ncbi:MAG: hypothetical protein AAB387_08835, partial [candidate division NC10 bacterium]